MRLLLQHAVTLIVIILVLNHGVAQALAYPNWVNIRNTLYGGVSDPLINTTDWVKIYNISEVDNHITCPHKLDPLQREIQKCSNRRWYNLWSRWCSTQMQDLQDAEEPLLTSMGVNYTGRYVDVGCISELKNDYIWTVSTNEASNNTPVVLIHGFGAGLGLWTLNIPDISYDRPVYAFDILGFGRSTRTPFAEDPIKIEQQFIQSIEGWREILGIDSMILLGHSFGGYLAASYAYQYPYRVYHLILADPWGFPEQPQTYADVPLLIKAMRGVIKKVNPMGLLRTVGQLGPTLLQKIRPDLSRRFSKWMNNSDEIIPNYLYHCNVQEPTGEEAFGVLMAGFGWSKYPMIYRMNSLDPELPITFIYGERSWVDKKPALITQQLRNTSYVNIQIIKGASHHVYADKYQEFNDLVRDIANHTDRGILPALSPVPDIGDQGSNVLRFINAGNE